MKLAGYTPKTWIVDLIVVALLVLLFAAMYIPQMSWGSWGDDSPGYIYTAGQMYRGEELVIQDPLVKRGLEYFGNEKFARFLAPTHHEIIAPTGWVASRYPTGLSVMMAVLGRIGDVFGFTNGYAMYFITPLMAVFAVVLVYAVAVLWLPFGRYSNRGIGILAAISTGLTPLFSDYAVSQPMRDIPAAAMLLLSLVTIGVIKHRTKRTIVLKGVSWFWLIVSGMAFAQAINIRETSIILFPALLVAIHLSLPNLQLNRANWKMLARILGIWFLAVIAVLSITIVNSIDISVHKEKFRAKDISGIAITSNFDHIQSLSPAHLFNNQGKFRPGVGGVQEYWLVLQKFSAWEFFLPMAVVGLVSIWRRNRKMAWLFVYWIGSIYLLFGMWINPYARYILPLLPMVALLSAVGTVQIIPWLQRVVPLSRGVAILLALVWTASVFIGLQPAVTAETSDIQNRRLTNKSIRYTDLLELETVSNTIQARAATDSNRPALVLMLGQWKPGISEMLMAHNDVTIIRYPSKPNERASEDQVNAFIASLNNDYQLFVWYDDTASAPEQRLLAKLQLESIGRYQFSFQSNVDIYASTQQ